MRLDYVLFCRIGMPGGNICISSDSQTALVTSVSSKMDEQRTINKVTLFRVPRHELNLLK